MVGLSLAAPSDHGVAAAGTCVPAGADKRSDNGRVVIYARSGGGLFGCLHSTGRRVLIGISVHPLGVAGRYVAAVEESCDKDSFCQAGEISVFDLRTGRRVTHVEFDAEGPEVTDLVLRATGSMAYISTPVTTRGSTFLVWRLPRGGRPERLARGDQIEPKSLRRKGGRVTWRNGSATETSRLP